MTDGWTEDDGQIVGSFILEEVNTSPARLQVNLDQVIANLTMV